jgi:hypothetical protein
MMYDREKSDLAIVAVKPTNKAGQPAAELEGAAWQRLGVSSAHVFHSWGKRRSVAGKAADIAQTRRASDWKRPV